MIKFNFINKSSIFFLNGVNKFYNFLTYEKIINFFFFFNKLLKLYKNFFYFLSFKFLFLISFFLYYIMLFLGNPNKGFLILNFIRLIILFFIKYLNKNSLKDFLLYLKPNSFDIDKKGFISSTDNFNNILNNNSIKFFEFDVQYLKLINFNDTRNSISTNLTKDILISKGSDNIVCEETFVITKSMTTIVKDTVSSVLTYSGEVLSLHAPFIISSIVLLGIGVTGFLISKQIEYALFKQDYMISGFVDFELLKKYGFLNENTYRLKQISSILKEHAQGRFFKDPEDFAIFLDELSIKLASRNEILDAVVLKYFYLKIVDPNILEVFEDIAQKDLISMYRVIKDSYFDELNPTTKDEIAIGSKNTLVDFYMSGDYLE